MSASATRRRNRDRLRTAIPTTDPEGLAAYAASLRPMLATLRTLAEDATAARPVYSREHLRHEMLKLVRALGTRLDVATGDLPALDSPDHGDPAGVGCAGPSA